MSLGEEGRFFRGGRGKHMASRISLKWKEKRISEYHLLMDNHANINAELQNKALTKVDNRGFQNPPTFGEYL